METFDGPNSRGVRVKFHLGEGNNLRWHCGGGDGECIAASYDDDEAISKEERKIFGAVFFSEYFAQLEEKLT